MQKKLMSMNFLIILTLTSCTTIQPEPKEELSYELDYARCLPIDPKHCKAEIRDWVRQQCQVAIIINDEAAVIKCKEVLNKNGTDNSNKPVAENN